MDAHVSHPNLPGSLCDVPACATDGLARVIYQAKDGGSSKTFLALDWLA